MLILSIIVGLICLYARPFTNNRPVGPLSDEIVPPEEKDVHETIIEIRHKLFAHAEASAVLRDDDYPNDVFLMNYKGKSSLTLARFAPKLESLKQARIPQADESPCGHAGNEDCLLSGETCEKAVQQTHRRTGAW
jgi:hypothetical protein